MHNAKFIFKFTQTWGRIFYLSFLNVYVEVYKRVQHITSRWNLAKIAIFVTKKRDVLRLPKQGFAVIFLYSKASVCPQRENWTLL